MAAVDPLGQRPPTAIQNLKMTHLKSSQYNSSEGTSFDMNTASAGFHTVNFDSLVEPMITLTLPRVDFIGAIGTGTYAIVGITSTTAGRTLRFQTLLPTEYINHGVSTTYDYVTDGTRRLFMIIAPGQSTSQFKNRWVIRYFGGEDASLNIQALLAGVGISVAEAPLGTWTITNTLPDQVRTITAGAGISVTGGDPNFTITAVPEIGSLAYWTGGIGAPRQNIPIPLMGVDHPLLLAAWVPATIFLSSSANITNPATGILEYTTGANRVFIISGEIDFNVISVVTPYRYHLGLKLNGVDIAVAFCSFDSTLVEGRHNLKVSRAMTLVAGDELSLTISSTENNSDINVLYCSLNMQ